MGECATISSNFKLQLQRSEVQGYLFKSQKSLLKRFPRYSSLPSQRVNKLSISHVKSRVSNRSPLKCSCLGTMIDFESVAPSNWVIVIDQVLLTASVFLAYIAGAIPSKGSYVNSRRNKSNSFLPENSIFFGSTIEKEDQLSSQNAWDVVKGKITKSLITVETAVRLGENMGEVDLDRIKRPLSLYAIANGPKYRLLLSSIEQLEKEVHESSLVVNEIPDTSMSMEREEWLGLFSSTIKKACQFALISWMEKEFITENCEVDKELLISMSEKLKGDDIILGNFKKFGKFDLFADVIGFLRYGYFRECSYYDHNVYPVHGGAILEDLIITIADAISSIYLEVISVDSDNSEKISNFGLSLCTLSNRALQKLRNEVAMRDWIQQNFGEIVLMYEDRFDLQVLKIEPYSESSEKLEESLSWWKRLTLKKTMAVESSMGYSVISPFSLTLKRTRELRALKGWMYYFSLILELSDIAVPMVKAIVSQVRNAISFFLVSLIGRSVGLVYTGIRQSLRWK